MKLFNYEMKKIFDQKTVVFEILNNNFFLFVIENEIEIKEKRIFFSCGFYSYDEDIISELNYFKFGKTQSICFITYKPINYIN